MDTRHILCTLLAVTYFFVFYPSDLLTSSRPVQKPYTLIDNAEPHTEGGSHWLAIRLTPHSANAYYFYSYGIVPLVSSIQAFIRQNCTTCDYKKRQLHDLTSVFCGQYYCQFALYMDRGTLPSNSSRSSRVGSMQTDRWSRCLRPNLGPPCRVAAAVNAVAAAYKCRYFRKSRHS